MMATKRAWVTAVAALALGCGSDDGGDSGNAQGGSAAATSGGTAGVGGSGGSEMTGGAAGAAMGGTAGVGGSGGVGGEGGFAGTGGVAGAAGMGGAGGTGGSAAQALLQELGTTVWHGLQSRGGVERAYEIEFDAGSLLWAEIRNPYGPARLREMRSFSATDSGGTPVLSSTVISPAGWPIHPENGRMDDWTVEIIDGNPRQLAVTRNSDGVTETFDEGPWPAPETGLTATVRVFPSSGDIFEAFCDVSGSLTGSIDYQTILDFARGKSSTTPLSLDRVAGVELGEWRDDSGNNQFAVTDIDGFDRLGGTLLSDQFNFTVTYTGTLGHAGGNLFMREADDAVTDALWVFLDDGVGSANVNDIFFENHSITLVSDDETVSDSFNAGALPFEAIVVRCSTQLTPMTLQVSQDGSSWTLVADQPTEPEVDSDLFPPAL